MGTITLMQTKRGMTLWTDAGGRNFVYAERNASERQTFHDLAHKYFTAQEYSGVASGHTKEITHVWDGTELPELEAA